MTFWSGIFIFNYYSRTKDSDEKVYEKWREKLDLTEPKNSFLRYFEYQNLLKIIF